MGSGQMRISNPLSTTSFAAVITWSFSWSSPSIGLSRFVNIQIVFESEGCLDVMGSFLTQLVV